MMFSLTELEDKLWRPATAQIIFICMLVIIGYELLSGLMQFYQIYAGVKKTSTAVLHLLPSKAPQRTTEKILVIPIFGEYLPKALVDLDVKPSVLNLTLAGIIFSQNAQRSMAIISEPGSQPKSFFVGDTVPGGAKIKQITPDGVVLIRDGELESLSLPKSELHFEPLPLPLKQNNE